MPPGAPPTRNFCAMSSRGETREQPSIPGSTPGCPCTASAAPPASSDPPGLSTEHVGLAVTTVALTSAVGALVVEHMTQMELLRKGTYSVLAALAVVGVVSYFGVRILRELTGLRSGQVVVRETLRQRQAAAREVREPVGAGHGHRPRGGDRSEYWGVYSDVMEDLGGIDGPPSEN